MSEQVQLDKKKSMKEEKIRAFMKNKLAVAGAVLLLTMIVLAALSPIIAPYGFDEQNYEIARQTPSLQHLAGTDELGRDIFSRILYGGRVSLTIGIISVGIGLIFGGSLGVIAAYYGGVTETVIMRVIDVLMAIPSIILSISICAALGSGIVNTMIAVGISSIPTYARVFRSSVISEKSTPEAVTASGVFVLKSLSLHLRCGCYCLPIPANHVFLLIELLPPFFNILHKIHCRNKSKLKVYISYYRIVTCNFFIKFIAFIFIFKIRIDKLFGATLHISYCGFIVKVFLFNKTLP